MPYHLYMISKNMVSFYYNIKMTKWLKFFVVIFTKVLVKMNANSTFAEIAQHTT